MVTYSYSIPQAGTSVFTFSLSFLQIQTEGTKAKALTVMTIYGVIPTKSLRKALLLSLWRDRDLMPIYAQGFPIRLPSMAEQR